MKTFLPRIIFTAIIAFLFARSALAAESLSVLLQKGIYAEETEGNLDSAIKIYEQITTEGASNRSLIAQAQYRLAVCYQKQGKKTQAVGLLNELTKQLPSNDPLVEKTRELLAQLGVTPAGELLSRKLPRLEARWLSCVSPDGRHIAFVARENTDLCVYECATGKTWKIGECDPGSLNQNQGHAMQDGVFSPDGRHFALAKEEKRLGRSEVWMYTVDGSSAKKIYDRNSAGGWLCPISWSADSTQLMICLWEANQPPYQSLIAINADTGNTTLIRRIFMDASGGGDWRLSWDDRYLAVRRGGNDRWIVLIDLKTGAEENLVERDVRSLIGWTADNQLLFRAMRAGTKRNEYWFVGVKEGRAAAAPVFIGDKPQFLNAGTPLSSTRDGSVFFHVSDEKNGSYPYVLDRIPAKKLAAKLPEPLASTEIPLTEIMGDGNAIMDRTLGFGASVPPGLTVTSAVSRGPTRVVNLKSEASDAAVIRLTYRATNPWPDDVPVLGAAPPAPDDVDSWLRGFADRMAQTKAKANDGYANDGSSFRPREVGGRRALSWTGQFSRDDRKWLERFTLIYSGAAWALFSTLVQPTEAEAVSPAVERLVATTRLP